MPTGWGSATTIPRRCGGCSTTRRCGPTSSSRPGVRVPARATWYGGSCPGAPGRSRARRGERLAGAGREGHERAGWVHRRRTVAGPATVIAPGWPVVLRDGLVLVRPYHRADARVWSEVRRTNEQWLARWEPTPPGSWY